MIPSNAEFFDAMGHWVSTSTQGNVKVGDYFSIPFYRVSIEPLKESDELESALSTIDLTALDLAGIIKRKFDKLEGKS